MLTVKIEGLEDAEAMFREWPDILSKHRRKLLGEIGQTMVREWQRQLKGPRSADRLGVVTGTLKRSPRAWMVGDRRPNTQAVVVGTRVPYAAVHEFGFDGDVQVRAHTRLGRPVRAHTRRMRMPMRPHMRPAVRETRKRILPLVARRWRLIERDLRKVKGHRRG